MVGGGTEIQFTEELVGIGGVGHHAGTVGRGSLGHDDVGAGVCGGACKQQEAGRKGEDTFHSVRILVCFYSTKIKK